MDGDSQADIANNVSRYSVLVGFLLIIVFVVPCVVFALIAKKFQSQTTARKASTVSRLVGAVFATEDGVPYHLPDSDSSGGYGTFGQINISPDELECLERVVFLKGSLTCIETWKAYAPPQMHDGESIQKRLIAVRKLGPTSSQTSDRDGTGHSWCLRAELSSLTRIPPNHFMLNLLGVCSVSGGNPHALLFEYPLYGSLHSYLICKRRGRISNNTSPWAGLQRSVPAEDLVMALPEADRASISSIVDNYNIRSHPFLLKLNEPFSATDKLVLGLQIVGGMEFLIDNGIFHKRLSTENVVISSGFHLKLTGVDYEAPAAHRGNTVNRLKRSPSGRNLLKWDAPEVIEHNEYSEKSEVWRFGMTLWELCSLGDTPFPDIPNRALIELIKKGQKPQIPDGCDREIFSIMEGCWNLKSEKRPMFRDLTEKMKSLLEVANSVTSTPQLSLRATPTPETFETYAGYWTPPGPSTHTYRPRPTSVNLIQRTSRQSNSTFEVAVVTTPPVNVSPVPPSPPEDIPGYEETDV